VSWATTDSPFVKAPFGYFLLLSPSSHIIAKARVGGHEPP
jgi:hypothetical protein